MEGSLTYADFTPVPDTLAFNVAPGVVSPRRALMTTA
jgi:hypothetical protein